ncbi:MAG: hypothetical protein RLN85_04005, partial [Pseudomonadales bacterium]
VFFSLGAVMRYSSFQNPRKNWSNIDILFTKEGRHEIEKLFPNVFPLVDWPELREFFDKREKVALNVKRRNHYCGVAAVLTGVLGLSILSFVPWLSNYIAHDGLTLMAIGLLATGILLGLWMRFVSSAPRTWLVNRFWAERVRQFQFQYFVSHLPQMAEAMVSEDKIQAWLAARAEAFRQLAFDASQNPVGVYEAVVADNAGKKCWLECAGPMKVTLPSRSPERDKLISYLKRLRVGYQLQYARSQNLAANIYSKKAMAAFATKAIFGLIVAFVLISLIIAVLILSKPVDPVVMSLLFGVQGLVAAMIAGVRVMEEGLAWRAEATRYIVYEAGLTLAEEKAGSISDDEIAEGLMAVEKLAYDELRGFLIAHRDPRFII